MLASKKEIQELKSIVLYCFKAEQFGGVVGALSGIVGHSSKDVCIQVNAGWSIVFTVNKTSPSAKSFVFDLKVEEDAEDALEVIINNI